MPRYSDGHGRSRGLGSFIREDGRSHRRRPGHVRLVPQRHRKHLRPRFGIASTLIDGSDLNAWREAIRPNTKLFFFETPSNPNLDSSTSPR